MNFRDQAIQIQNEIQSDPLAQIEFHQINSARDCSVRVSEILQSKITKQDSSITSRVQDEFQGFGPLNQLMKDPRVTEIMVNSKDDIWFEKDGNLYQSQDLFISDLTFENFLYRLLSELQIQLTQEQPFANARLHDFRVHLVFKDISQKSTVLTLRRVQHQVISFNELERMNWAGTSEIDLIQSWIAKRKNFLVIGETGSGKTTVINSCLNEISDNDRAIIIEDTDELIYPNSVSLKLLTRQQNLHLPQIDLSELVKQSLRMRPDRLVIGEVRAGEAKDLIMALSTGHRGCLGTLHAATATQALMRLEMLVQLGAPQWSISTIRKLIGLSLDGIITVGKNSTGQRVLKSIHQISSIEESGVLLECHFQS